MSWTEGVLAQENIVGDPHAQGSSYIAASYVKYLESAGARVVPIRINRIDEEYEKIFNSINGPTDYFPIWGMCQGLQQMTVLTSNKNLLTPTETKAVALPFTFTPANRYPFYAVQWHPEKSPFEWVDKPGMVHSAASVRASFYTAHFFVSEADINPSSANQLTSSSHQPVC
ncbi:gamma-glutamyl hydrolase-like isoform X1 [Oncorhynchus clarkii lewisi]|uniref:gamma-glutamyl hydrolase-like isoform X1 n=1 Tax=Oncorhynchus clarkii lewisi TaxID=490388 RepID=UPI0039B88B6D